MPIEQTAQEESQSSVTEDEDNDAYFEVTKSQSHNGVKKMVPAFLFLMMF